MKINERESVCDNCERLFIYKKNKGHSRKLCNSCAVEVRRKNLKKMAVEYKGGCCQVCEYKKYIGALEFHHLDKKEKDKNFRMSGTNSWKRLKIEVDKCILVCSNCHREIEAGLVDIASLTQR